VKEVETINQRKLNNIGFHSTIIGHRSGIVPIM
jgi:hypothetical protein